MPSDDLLDEADGGGTSREAGDLFYRGILIRLSRGAHEGAVRSDATGREIRFELQHVELPGGAAAARELREGMAVGYDVGWTSRGLRVTRIFPLR